jgi:type II secretory pathway predicted ATPase ExeA
VGHTPILLFDRTEDASEEALEAFGMLLKRPGKWSAILAVDEEQLVELPRKLLEACDLKIDLPAWDWSLTRDFLEFSLSRAGANREIFTPQGITRIHELSEGIAKVVEQLAEFTLIAGAAQEISAVDAPLVDAVLDEFSLTLGPKFQLL